METKPLDQNSTAAKSPKPKFGLVFWLVITALVFLGIGIGGTWWFASRYIGKTSDAMLNFPKKPVVSSSSSKSTTTDPYAGWKSYTLKYEGFSFKYPSDFTLTDTSKAYSPNSSYGKPGSDYVKLAAADGITINIQTGLDGIGGGCPNCTVDLSSPISLLGQSLYLNYIDQNGDGKVSSMTVSTKASDWFGTVPGKNTRLDTDNTLLPMTITATWYLSDSSLAYKSLADFESNPEIVQAKLIFESMQY